jgi:nitrogen fixation NifU-like protein
MAYSKEVLDHFKNPRNVGQLDENDENTGTSIVGAPSCGDVLQFSIKIEDGKIVDAKFKAFGCGSAIASSSYLTQQVIGKTVEEAMEIHNEDIASALSLPPIKWHCSVLAEDAIKGSIKNYKEKNNL